jgi:hypothetical protein
VTTTRSLTVLAAEDRVPDQQAQRAAERQAIAPVDAPVRAELLPKEATLTSRARTQLQALQARQTGAAQAAGLARAAPTTTADPAEILLETQALTLVETQALEPQAMAVSLQAVDKLEALRAVLVATLAQVVPV